MNHAMPNRASAGGGCHTTLRHSHAFSVPVLRSSVCSLQEPLQAASETLTAAQKVHVEARVDAMVKRSGYRGKRGGKFVKIEEWVMKTEAWRDLSVGAKCLYLELRRRFNGANNGEIRLSHREAAAALNVHRNTVGRYFRELEEHGFIRKTQDHYLGPSGVGQTANWALEEEATPDGKPAGKAFARWKKPRTKNGTG